MAWLNQPILWLLFAAAIPIIIHLLNRRRHRTVKWAAMSFILKATRESRGKKKLKHILILTARTLALATLVLAIAQPLVGGFLGGGSKLDTVVLVLDRSLSMETETGVDGESKREKAIQQAKQALIELGNPNLILVDSATGTIQDIEKLETLDVISSAAATDTKANIPALIDDAVNHIISSNTGKTEIWVASDLQATNWQVESNRWESIQSGLASLKQKPKLRVIALTAEPEDNRAVKISSVRRNGADLVVDFEITRVDTTIEKEIDTTIFINGKEFKTDKFSIEGQSMALQETINLRGEPISGFGYISISPDSNNRDNNAYFAYGEATPSHTIVVTEGGDSVRYLELASSLFEHQTSETLETHQLDSGVLKKTSMIVWQASLPTGNNAKIMQRFIENGGTAIFLPSSDDSSDMFLGFGWGEMQRSPSGQYFIVTSWDDQEGPQRNYSNGVEIPLDQLHAIKRRSISGELSALADWDDGTTAMGRIIEGQGTAYFIATLPDRRWSDLDNGSITVPIFQSMLALGNKRFGSAFFSDTGRNSPLADTGEELVSLIDNSKVNERYSIEQDEINSQPIYLAGVKRVGERIVATNRPADEDDWTRINEDELDNILEGTNYSLFENSGESDGSSTRQIWQWLLVAALVFLIIEAILCLQKKSARRIITPESKPVTT